MLNAHWTDPNVIRVKSWVGPLCRRLPTATLDYLVEKLPVAQWLPHYHPKWIIQDVIAGITLGVMFIPQGLAYAKIATIPVEHGLYSCWLPSALYFFLGTSKGEKQEAFVLKRGNIWLTRNRTVYWPYLDSRSLDGGSCF